MIDEMKKCKIFKKHDFEEVANVLLGIQYSTGMEDIDYSQKKRVTGFLKFMVCRDCNLHDIEATSYLHGEKN